jgi:hypothetical protein
MKINDLPRPIRNFIKKYLWFRPAIVYAYSCLDPATLLREWWAYVGQTRQELASRHAQHMGFDPRYKNHAQSWSDLYPEVRIVWQGKCPDFVLDLIEKYYIKRHKAIYNYIHNTKNPRRIPKYAAIEQRRQRDRLRGLRRPGVM